MKITRQIAAQSILAFGALMRTVNPHPDVINTFSLNNELQVNSLSGRAFQNDSSLGVKTTEAKFPYGGRRLRRPYIQHSDGSVDIL